MLRVILRAKQVGVLLHKTNPLIRHTNTVNWRTLSTKDTQNYAKAAVTKDNMAQAGSGESLDTQSKVNTTSKESAEQTEYGTQNHTNPFTRENPGFSKAAEELSEEETAQRLKVLQLEVDIAYQEGRRVPPLDFFQERHWKNVLTLPSKSARIKYYSYLWQIAMKKLARDRQKEERNEAGLIRRDEMRKEREENPHIVYGLGHTSLFLRIYDSTINFWMNNRLTRAMQFAPKIVLDCSYDENMTKREALNTAKQLMFCFAENRAHDDPFDLHYCNVNLQSICMQSLQRYIPTMLNDDFPMNVHSQCFTELFPKENIVYLTPHCRNELEAYNADDVYIVGAIVDTVNNEPLSLAKAKKLGLRMARLPLDRHLQWGAGSGKSLTLNQMINIMLDLKSTGDWSKALSHVPRRKIVNLEIDEMRQRKFLNKRANQLNVRLDKILNSERDSSNFTTPKYRARKDNLQFNLDTWASKKKQRS